MTGDVVASIIVTALSLLGLLAAHLYNEHKWKQIHRKYDTKETP